MTSTASGPTIVPGGTVLPLIGKNALRVTIQSIRDRSGYRPSVRTKRGVPLSRAVYMDGGTQVWIVNRDGQPVGTDEIFDLSDEQLWEHLHPAASPTFLAKNNEEFARGFAADLSAAGHRTRVIDGGIVKIPKVLTFVAVSKVTHSPFGLWGFAHPAADLSAIFEPTKDEDWSDEEIELWLEG